MNPTLPWLVSRSLIHVEKRDSTWIFSFGPQALILTEAYWRLIAGGRIHVTSEDDGQLFGLSSPVDAASRVISSVNFSTVKEYKISDISSDLSIHFSLGVTLEFLNLSCGYESWRSSFSGHEVICMGGGGLTESTNAG